ncbi:hypothetical protein PROFUN_05006 [Planoprotostelium fungivorum]|uniref:PH domain-containing protein n=1 Tax=Planoprotostelium fungivorum TaxID=1890364 RepID=A0A2P6NS48_9EUKA|nr:hypothetical protein PROFUN_05006 [Planoprotostelium fungivorum]
MLELPENTNSRREHPFSAIWGHEHSTKEGQVSQSSESRPERNPLLVNRHKLESILEIEKPRRDSRIGEKKRQPALVERTSWARPSHATEFWISNKSISFSHKDWTISERHTCQHCFSVHQNTSSSTNFRIIPIKWDSTKPSASATIECDFEHIKGTASSAERSIPSDGALTATEQRISLEIPGTDPHIFSYSTEYVIISLQNSTTATQSTTTTTDKFTSTDQFTSPKPSPIQQSNNRLFRQSKSYDDLEKCYDTPHGIPRTPVSTRDDSIQSNNRLFVPVKSQATPIPIIEMMEEQYTYQEYAGEEYAGEEYAGEEYAGEEYGGGNEEYYEGYEEGYHEGEYQESEYQEEYEEYEKVEEEPVEPSEEEDLRKSTQSESAYHEIKSRPLAKQIFKKDPTMRRHHTTPPINWSHARPSINQKSDRGRIAISTRQFDTRDIRGKQGAMYDSENKQVAANKYATSLGSPAIDRKFFPNPQLKKMNSRASIGMPENITKSTLRIPRDLNWIDGSLVMKGVLEWAPEVVGQETKDESTVAWEKRSCMIENGRVTIYDQNLVAAETFSLKNAIIVVDRKERKSFQIILESRTYSFRTSGPDENNYWTTAVKMNGAIDQNALPNEKRKAAIEREKERQQDKQYAQEKIKNLTNAMRVKAGPSVNNLEDPAQSPSQIFVEGVSSQKPVALNIRVTFGTQEWYIYRTEKEMSGLYSNLVTKLFCPVDLGHLKGKYPSGVKSSQMAENLNGFQEMLRGINEEKSKLFAHKSTRIVYTRFFGPFKYGDTKPPNFVFPFELELE